MRILNQRSLVIGVPLAALLYVAALFVFVEPASAYLVLSRRTSNGFVWNSEFQSNTALGGFPSNTRLTITNGAYQWDDVNTGANFNADESYSSWNAWFGQTNFGNAGYDPNIPGVTTHTFTSDGKVSFSTSYLNNTWTWSATNCSVDFSAKRAHNGVVVTHEIGHWIRLGHDSNHTEAVMWPDTTCKLTTVADDDNGVKNIYGNR